jgi:hypothetical protein
MTDRLKPLLAILGAYQLALGTFMIVAPGTFFEKIGPYGIQNDHYTRDAATFTLALGLVLLIAAWRPGWRAPAIAGALFQYVLHSVNHLVDIGEADPESLGPTNFLLLALGAALLGWMFMAASRAEARP